MSGYETASLEELRRDDGWAPIRLALDIRSFGINSWTGRDAGRHRHPGARRGADRA